MPTTAVAVHSEMLVQASVRRRAQPASVNT